MAEQETPAVETPAPAPAPEAPQVQVDNPAPGTQEAAPPAYEPNFKFKVKDKELEFDEALRPLVKEKAIEEKLRDLYTRSHGIEEIQAQRAQVEQTFNTVRQQLGRVAQFVQKGDMDQAFAHLGIPQEAVLKWVSEKLRVEGLPESEKNLYNQNRQAELARQQAEDQQSLLRQQVEQSMVQTRSMELNMVLARDDIKSIADAYDARLARPGAFRDEVKNYGAMVWYNSRQDISAEEAAIAVANRFKPFLGATGGAASPSPNNTVIIDKSAAPTMPAVGRAGSPGKKAFNSIADLKAEAKRQAALNNGG